MTSRKTYYITTPIYYVNGRPHIGSALTTLCCDFLKRFRMMRGEDTWFLTGTDENATKNQEAAQEAGVDPLDFVTRLADDFRQAWDGMAYAYDDFIRTTEPRHVRTVQEVFRRLRDTGDLYRGTYEGWYCVSDETFFRETDVRDDHLCPNEECRKPLRRVQEENWFFRLSAYGDRLLEHIEANPEFLQPASRRNEVIGFIKQGLRDASVTRSNNGWGIPVPDEPDKVIYVWFDALINYLSATGWPDDPETYARLWPASVHMMAKEIFVRFHATLWPAMIIALGLPLPQTVYAHGWWVGSGGKKEGKRTGGLPHPLELVRDIESRSGASHELAVDALRYLLLREMVFHGDSEFSEENFLRRYNADLANDLGNLCNRTVSMVGRYCDGVVPAAQPDPEIGAVVAECVREYETAVDEFRFHAALEAAWKIVSRVNRYIVDQAPWNLAKADRRDELDVTLTTCIEAIRVLSILVAPAMPHASAALRQQLGLAEGQPQWADASRWGASSGLRVATPRPLYPRIQDLTAESLPTPPEKERAMEPQPTDTVAAAPTAKPTITYDDFAKIDLRIADIIEAEPVPNADKLLKLTVQVGDETRTILAGIAEMYEPAELKSKQIVIVANLAPRKLRGIESQGMLLAADVDGQAVILQPETEVPAGAPVR